MVPDIREFPLVSQIVGPTDLNREDYGSIEDWETILPWTSRLPKSAILEVYSRGGRI